MQCTACGTGSCNKLNVYDWLADMKLPAGQKPFDVVEVRFKNSRKQFYRNVDNIALQAGDVVAVEASPGHDIGTVSLTGELVRLQLKKHNLKPDSHEIRTLYRLARSHDLEKWEAVRSREQPTMLRARKVAGMLGLKMKISDVEFQGDGKKATFSYTAEERVDFRELIKRLAEEFRIRIDMRQIGIRQEASKLGGIGSCGRELCCSTWLTDFKAVSTSSARYQNLSINPAKLAGQCGKLKCCLNYELDAYMDALKEIPNADIKLHTAKGTAVHLKTDIFKRKMWYAYLDPDRREGGQFFPSDAWIQMTAARVQEIIEMNRSNQKPPDLVEAGFEEVEEEPDYTDVVGQDSLTRMDQRRKKKKRKKKRRPQQQKQQQQQKKAP